MKPLLSREVKRGVKLDEWESAAHQATLDGLNAFRERQQKRMVEARAKADAEAQLLADREENTRRVVTVFNNRRIKG
jgi:hypothetical protein